MRHELSDEMLNHGIVLDGWRFVESRWHPPHFSLELLYLIHSHLRQKTLGKKPTLPTYIIIIYMFFLTLLAQCIQCHYAECRDYLNVILSSVMLSVITLSAIMLSVIRLNVYAECH